MLKKEVKANVLVIVQFLCALFLVVSMFSVTLRLLPVIMITVAIAIGLWSVLTMQIGNLRFSPIPKSSAKLVTNGPYRFVRHPMYTAALLGMLGAVININTLLCYGVWAILFIDILIKLRFEEELLMEKFPEYQEYMNNTKSLLPFVW